MRPWVAYMVYRLWRYLAPLPPPSARRANRMTREFAEATREDRRLLYRDLLRQPGFQLLLEELEHHKANFESALLALPSSISDSMPPDEVKARLIRCYEAIFWLGWIPRKVERAASAKPQQVSGA